jgi:uncharacterized membrane-anchored protein YjiN (DUF445 family)
MTDKQRAWMDKHCAVLGELCQAGRWEDATEYASKVRNQGKESAMRMVERLDEEITRMLLDTIEKYDNLEKERIKREKGKGENNAT